MRKPTRYAWNTKPRKSHGLTRKELPKSHFKQLSHEQKAQIKPMSFKRLPGELRNAIYPELLDQAGQHPLIFANWNGGVVPGWPASKTLRIPIGLLTSDKQIRKECLPLVLEQADFHVRILSAHLKSSDELYAWVSDTDCIPFSSIDTTLLTKLSVTIFLPCSFETTQPDQAIDYTFLTSMTKLETLRLRIQVNVPSPHERPWKTFHQPVPTSTFTPFVNRTIEALFRAVRKETKIEFGDGVKKENDGLGTWVDERADNCPDMGWMYHPLLAERDEIVNSGRYGDRDTVAVPIDQAEQMFGQFRAVQGVAAAAVVAKEDPVEAEDGVVEDVGQHEENAVVVKDGDVGGLSLRLKSPPETEE